MPVYKDKNGKWKVNYRYTDYTGKSRQTTKRGFATRREAVAWEREQKLRLEASLDMTFGSFVELYITDMKVRVKENTWHTKEHIIRTKILPYFKDRKIDEIKSRDIVSWQNELLTHQKKNGEPYSPTYLKSVHSQLSAIFNHAVKYYGLRNNPAKMAGGMGKEESKDMQFWTQKEYLTFLEAVMDILHRYLKILMRFQKRIENTAIETADDSVASTAQETALGDMPQPVDPAALQHAKAEYMYMQRIHDRLDALNRKAYAIGKTIDSLTKKLDKISGNIFHIFEKRDLEKEIAAEKEKRKKTRDQIQILPKEYGYATVSDFETAFRTAESEYMKLLEVDEEYRECRGAFHDRTIPEELKSDSDSSEVLSGNMTISHRAVSFGNRTEATRNNVSSNQIHQPKKSVLQRLAEKQDLVDNNKEQQHNPNRRREEENRNIFSL